MNLYTKAEKKRHTVKKGRGKSAPSSAQRIITKPHIKVAFCSSLMNISVTKLSKAHIFVDADAVYLSAIAKHTHILTFLNVTQNRKLF